MKCPKCGYEIPEGHLLCEKCGSEIKIVPDFEIDVENSISETLSTIADDVSPEDKKKEPESTDSSNVLSKEEQIEEEFFKEPSFFKDKKPTKRGLAFLLLGGAAFFALVVFAVLFIYMNYSVNYQIRKADSLVASGRYDKAIAHIEKGIAINSKNTDLYISKANILFAKGDADGALDIVEDYINNKNVDSETLSDFYGLYIEIFEKEQNYDQINKKLLECPDESIKERYASYMAAAPEFSIPTGSYEGGTSLEINTVSEGTVYYTTDGSVPSKEHGSIYNEPIILEKGEYDVKAVFVNGYGVISDVSGSYYLIDLTAPSEPIVNPESGTYNSSFTISAFSGNVTDSIYYTLDGTDPDEENGILYTDPIKAPLGQSNMCFVAISEDGVASEIVRRSYDFELKANMTGNEAYIYLLNDLYIKGKIADRAGKALNSDGTFSYVYDSMVEISGSGYYYILVEYFTDENNRKAMTGFMYAVDPYTGAAYYFLRDDKGNMSLLPV